MKTRLVLVAAIAGAASLAAVAACSDTDTASPGSSAPDGSARRDSATLDDDDDDDDSGTPTKDSGGKDADSELANEGEPCVFNRDCEPNLRCECESGACACNPGARGTGALGVQCDSGDQCASAVCVEGPGDGGPFYCSQECDAGSDCKAPLPRCLYISFVGQICARNP